MKLTYGELVASANNIITGEPGPFTRFRAVAKPFNTASRVRDIARQFEVKFKDFIEERDGLFERHAKKSEDGTIWEFANDDDREAFNAAHRLLLRTVIEIPGERIEPRHLLSSTVIADADLELLDWLIDDGVTERVDPVDPTDLDEQFADDLLELEENAEAAAA